MKVKPRITPNKNGGFSLIELMVGVIVVSIGVYALIEMYSTGSQMITEEYHRRIGLEKAQAKMEMARFFKTELDTVPRNMSGTFHEDLLPLEEGQEEAIPVEYTIVVTHSTELSRSSGLPVYSMVSLVYTWVERSQNVQTIEFKTYF
jgi:prepilin-type N-terminal cleavage/methylation domain-containing protein